jgi:hypothetical protein
MNAGGSRRLSNISSMKVRDMGDDSVTARERTAFFRALRIHGCAAWSAREAKILPDRVELAVD